MTYFNPTATYDKALRDQDKVVLQALLVGIIGSDPTFVTTEFDEAREYIRQRSVAINGQELILEESYKVQEDEYKKADWDEAYYQMNLIWLQDNFAVDDRLPGIKEMGKTVYQDKMTMGKSTYKNRMTPPQGSTGKSISVKKVADVRATGDDLKGTRLSGKSHGSWLDTHWKIVAIGVAIILILVTVIAFSLKEKTKSDMQSENKTGSSVAATITVD